MGDFIAFEAAKQGTQGKKLRRVKVKAHSKACKALRYVRQEGAESL